MTYTQLDGSTCEIIFKDLSNEELYANIVKLKSDVSFYKGFAQVFTPQVAEEQQIFV